MKSAKLILLVVFAWFASASSSAYAVVVGVDTIINSSTVTAFGSGDLSNTTASGPGWGSGYEIEGSFGDYIEFTLQNSLIDGTDWDIQFLEYDTNETHIEAAAVWLHEATSGIWYNVGSSPVVSYTATDGVLGGDGVWENPRGNTAGPGVDITGYYVLGGGPSEGWVNIADFFDIGMVYADSILDDGLTLATIAFDSVILTGVEFGGDNYDFDGVQVRYFASSAVPVPAAVWLFGSGLLGLIALGRRRFG
jgi:hypothetical protein